MRGAIAFAAWLCILGTATALGAEPQWTTYHRDPGRSGFDLEAGEAVAPLLDWQSAQLDGPIWGQPLVLGSRVYVATVADGVYALDASSGQILWHVSAGTPVPSGDLPCGDITPTVGIVGTPVIDVATNALYAVADVWNRETKQARHVLKGYSLGEGAEVLSTPVDPPGAEPTAYLQRTALNLDSGSVIFGFGGNDGDCANYRGAVVAAPENGEQPRFWQYQPKAPSVSGGAVWGASGPIVGPEGDIFAATGNPNPAAGKKVTRFDDSDAFLRLDPKVNLVAEPALEPKPAGSFEPPSWFSDSNSDLDMGSAGPELLPGGLIFQAGKRGTGYLLATSLQGEETKAVYEAQVCGGAGSFGGDAFANGVIYVACGDGTQALSYDQSAMTFAPLWQGPSDAFGPPIVAAGLVWSIATEAFEGGEDRTLYGLEPASGKPRYTITLPSPVADHFASPSAAGGRLFVSTGSSVSAYQITRVPGEEPPGEELPSEEHAAGLSPSGGSSPSQPAATVTTRGAGSGSSAAAPLAQLVHRQLRSSAGGRRVNVVLHCPSTTLRCAGSVRLLLVEPPGSHRGHLHKRPTRVVLAGAGFGPGAGVFTVTLRLDAPARSLLAHSRAHHLALMIEITASNTPRTRVIPVRVTAAR
jgi:outer membrane protein assembly factor BamB